jgi:hypothetical protein
MIEIIKHKHESYYDNDGNKLPSVTGILSVINKPFLINWANKIGREEGVTTYEYNKPTLLIGTLVHAMCQSYFTGDLINYEGISEEVITQAKKCFLQFEKWIKSLPNITFWHPELSLSDPILGFGGTMDLVVKISGLIYIIDYKTSNQISNEYKLQLLAYSKLLSSVYSVNADKLAVLQLPKDGSDYVFKVYDLPDANADYEVFEAAKKLYMWTQRD